jgi:tetratricopeptide (TPR) repeat protein
MSKLDNVPSKFAVDVLSVRIETDISSGDLDDAADTVEKLTEYDGALAKVYGSDIRMAEGDTEGALDMLRGMNGLAAADLRIARIFFDLGRFEESEKMLEGVRILPGDTSASIERFILMAKLDLKKGNPQQAVIRMMKARATAPDREKKKIDLMMKELKLN